MADPYVDRPLYDRQRNMNRDAPPPAPNPATPASGSRPFCAIIGLGLALLLVKNLHTNLADFDMWWNMATGRSLVQTGTFPYHDVFSYVPTLPVWIQHGWLSGLALYQTNVWLGDAGLQLLRLGLGLGTAGFVYLAARRHGAPALAAALTLAAVGQQFGSGFPAVRALVFTNFFFALSLYLLETARRNQSWRLLWLLVPTQILWANLHAGFLSGLGLIALYAVGQILTRQRFMPLLIVLAAAGSSTLINPYGVAYVREALFVSSTPTTDVPEWFRIWDTLSDHNFGSTSRFFLGLLGVTAVLAALAPRRDLTALLVLTVTAYLGVSRYRHIFFFLLACCVYAPVLLADAMRRVNARLGLSQRAPALQYLAAGLCFLAAFWSVPAYVVNPLLANPRSVLFLAPLSWEYVSPGVPYYPVKALRHVIERGLKGNLLPDLAWGGVAIWALYPDCRVAMDGRNESVYPLKVRNEYFDFLMARGDWRGYLERYPHDMILIKPYERIGKLLAQEPGWRVEYQDRSAVLFMRAPPLPAAQP